MLLPERTLAGDIRSRLLAGQHVFFEAEAFGMHEGPYGSVIVPHTTLSELGLQATQGEGPIAGNARDQPIAMRQQDPRPMPMHQTGCNAASLTETL